MLRQQMLRCVAKMYHKSVDSLCTISFLCPPKRKTSFSFSHIGCFQVTPSTTQIMRRTVSSNTDNEHILTTQITGVNMTAKVIEVQDGRTCIIEWGDGFQAKFHSVWLRHNCQCPLCRHGNLQRIFDVATVPATVRIKNVHCEGNNIHIIWSGEEKDHEGHIPLDYLRQHNYRTDVLKARREAVKCDKTVTEIPRITYEDITTSKQGLLRCLQQINEAGLSVVNGVPVEYDAVENVGELIGPVARTIYGKIFEVENIDNPINVAYLDKHIDPHQDLVYFESPPGLQLLHCIRFDPCVTGGESSFVDLFSVMEKFQTEHPALFHIMSTVPATFQKVHYEREVPVHMVNQKPHVKLNHYGEIVAVYWAPPFEGPLAVREEDVENYYMAYEMFAKAVKEASTTLQHRLQPGELVVFNNQRMLHARTEFKTNGGRRILRGCYINIDMFKSKTQVMNNLYGDGRLAKRVGNQCYF